MIMLALTFSSVRNTAVVRGNTGGTANGGRWQPPVRRRGHSAGDPESVPTNDFPVLNATAGVLLGDHRTTSRSCVPDEPGREPALRSETLLAQTSVRRQERAHPVPHARGATVMASTDARREDPTGTPVAGSHENTASM